MKVINAINLLRVIVGGGMLVRRLVMAVFALIYDYFSGGNLVAMVNV